MSSLAELLGLKKIRNVIGCGPADQGFDAIDLLETALAHNGDSIRQGDAVRQIVRHVNRGEPMFLMKFQYFSAHPKPVRRVDVAQGLVHK
jgi:hypothetical protein